MTDLQTPPPDQLDTDRLIEHILDRFHESHRRELPVLVDRATALAGHGASPDLADALQAMADALEQHMFKEEMRLFPMMSQGGSSLIEHLIDDMAAEHDTHRAAIDAMRSHIDALPPQAQACQAELRLGVDKLLADLAEHMRLEDTVLFPRFRYAGAGTQCRPGGR